MERFENNTVIFRDCAYKNEKLYLFDANNVLPMSLDLKNEKFRILPVEDVKQFRGSRFDLQTELGECLYAVEADGKYMCRYQLDTGYVKYIEINCGEKKDGNFALLEAYNDCIYIFNRFGTVVIYNTKTEDVQTIETPVKDKNLITGCRYNQSCYLFSDDGSAVLEFDIDSSRWKVHNSPDIAAGHEKVVHAVCNKTKIYILFDNALIVVWDVEKKQKKCINTAKLYYERNTAVSRICVTDKNIVVLPSLEEDIVYLDKQTYEVHCIGNYPVDFKYDSKKKTWTKYAGYCESDTAYYFACRTSNYILEISKISGKVRWIKSEIDIEEQFNAYKANQVIYEKKGGLQYMMEKILR